MIVCLKYLYNLLSVLVIVIVFLLPNAALAQGCSDAGFCTIGILHQFNGATEKKYDKKISLFAPVGLGDEKVVVFAPGIQYDKQLNDRWTVQAKLTANYANGELSRTAALSDAFLSGIYTFGHISTWSTSLMLSAKFFLNSSNLKTIGRSLPMQYQSSLGTIDLISGLSTGNEHWQFAAGWQQPLSGSNNNHFLPANFDSNVASNYPPSQHFDRKGDVLLRSGYTYKPIARLSLSGGLLGIYHLNNDTYKDKNNTLLEISGSRGLTLNVTFAALWKLNKKTTVGVAAGSPLVAREVRPDGLTRKFVIAPEINWNF